MSPVPSRPDPRPPRLSVALVVQRYGTEVDGGSETLCRQVAERLADSASVEVLTTTAVDYLTWKNELPAGVAERGGVRVRRFPVASRRWVRRFGRLSERLYRTPHTIEDELDWMIRQGPRTPELLAYLKDARPRFDAFVFFTYLYYPTYFGLPLVAGKSVLVPTLHDEPPAHFDIFRSLFWLPRAFVWNTPEERDLAREMFGIEGEGEVAGIGIDPPEAQAPDGFRRRHGLREFLLYVGRLDVWKGIPELLDHFARYRAERAPDLTLVLAGKPHMKLPSQAGVVPVGYLEDGEKMQALAAASATIIPSPFESLSVVALESWAVGTPVAASARSRAVVGQCARSRAGLAYSTYEDFRSALDRLRSSEGRDLGENGRRFVAEQCSWDRILAVYRRAIERASGGGR
ncbi:MAG TPA: glycosyltransferase family 4 protein [Candidatus Binatia bacterium]|nr:glycosyltransferase family 4 protein [Candidatus Binatia bacterium]